jgi:hypothetical protein
VFDHLPPFLTVPQAAKLLQIGRTRAYELTTEWEVTGGKSGIPCVRFGSLKRVPLWAIIKLFAELSAPAA